MIELHPYSLAAALLVAQQVLRSERRTYREITGEEFNPDTFAAQTAGFHGPAWAGAEGSTVHFVAGFVWQRGLVYRTWFASTPACWRPGNVGRVTELVADKIRQQLVLGGRVETVTLARNRLARDWYGKIGLAHEATMRRAGAFGDDLVLYSATEAPKCA